MISSSAYVVHRADPHPLLCQMAMLFSSVSQRCQSALVIYLIDSSVVGQQGRRGGSYHPFSSATVHRNRPSASLLDPLGNTIYNLAETFGVIAAFIFFDLSSFRGVEFFLIIINCFFSCSIKKDSVESSYNAYHLHTNHRHLGSSWHISD